MEKVKKLIRAGATIPGAIKEALGEPVSAFAKRKGVERAVLSNSINGNVRPPDAVIEALCTELGGTPDEWRELLWQAARPQPRSEQLAVAS